MNLELSGQQLTVIIGLLSALLILIIFFGRKWLQIKRRDFNKGTKIFSLHSRTKYTQVNGLKEQGFNFRLGLSFSLAFTFFLMSWTVYDQEAFYSYGEDFVLDETVEIIPRTPPPAKKLPPPPPPPKLEPVPEEQIEEDPEFVDESIDADDLVEYEPVEMPDEQPIAPPPPHIKEEPMVTEIFVIVEQMPMFNGCKDKTCSDKALLKYLYKHLTYPPAAAENGIEGKVTLQFVIETDGSVQDINVVRDIGGGCGANATKALMNMNKHPVGWTAGRQRGTNVRVLYTLPVTFKLN